MVVVDWLLAVGTPAVAGILIARLLAGIQHHARELRPLEERTRLVLDTAPDAFITLDRDGCITTWNAAAQRMFGWTEEEAVGRRMRELIMPPEYAEHHDTRRLALLDSPDPRATETFEVELVHRDGQRFPGEATCVEGRGARRGVRLRLHHRHRPSGCGGRPSARRCCASRPRAPRQSGWPRWSAACRPSSTRRWPAEPRGHPAGPREPGARRARGRAPPRSTWRTRAAGSAWGRPPRRGDPWARSSRSGWRSRARRCSPRRTRWSARRSSPRTR